MPEGLIFDLQRFSVHDGPGIRTTIFFKGCPLRCPWCQNPESYRPEPEVAFYEERCRGCGACAESCPLQAIEGSGRRLDRARCDGCGRCADACPYQALRRVGRRVEVGPLIEEALRDRPFFAASGGGVTLSGGEPTMQLGFMTALAAALHGAGISVGLQTCGQLGWNVFAPHLASLDFIHFDLKVLDHERHRAYCGVENQVILENAERLLEAAAPVLFRMPIVPGFTDGSNLEEVQRFLLRLGVRRLHLLRYHSMGDLKRARLGLPPPPAIQGAAAGEALTAAARALRAAGLEVSQ